MKSISRHNISLFLFLGLGPLTIRFGVMQAGTSWLHHDLDTAGRLRPSQKSTLSSGLHHYRVLNHCPFVC